MERSLTAAETHAVVLTPTLALLPPAWSGPRGRFRLLIIQSDEAYSQRLAEAAAATDRFWPIRRMIDGRFALEQLWTQLEQRPGEVPDVIITDLRVRGLDGVALTRELRRYSETQALLIAFIASHAGPLDQDAAENAGADFFVRRPRQAEQLAPLLHMIAHRAETKAPLPTRLLN